MRRVNRAAELEVFVAAARVRAFSGAARELGLSPSAVSKLVGRLEARLGARLFHRSTRRLSLTAEGEALNARAAAILAQLEEAEGLVSAARLPSGRIRLTTSASYLVHVLAPALPAFLAAYPDISIDVVQTDALSDFVGDQVDLAIRAGPLDDSGLVARSLGETQIVTVARPGWLGRGGERGPLALGFSYLRRSREWRPDGAADAAPRVRVDDGEGLRHLALAGIGPARFARFTVRVDLAAGRLAEVGVSKEREAFHVVYVGRAASLPARVVALIDYLVVHGRVDGS